MDQTICPSRGVVYFAALQQIVFNIDPRVLDSMIHDQGRSTQVSSSSQDLTSILDKYVPKWMGEDAFDGLCFHSPWVQSSNRSSNESCWSPEVELDIFRGVAKVQKLPASRSSSELSAHQMALSGVIAH